MTSLDVTDPGPADLDATAGPDRPDATGPQGTDRREAAGDSPELTDTRAWPGCCTPR